MKHSQSTANHDPRSSQHRYLPRPKWLRTSKASVKGKGTEMVMLSKDSPLSNIPAELQLDIIYFLPYEDVLNLKKTSRYFHYFVSQDVLQQCKQTHIDRWAEIEKQGGWPDCFPCYMCLQLKPKDEFYFNGTYGFNRAVPGDADTDRHCTMCAFKSGEWGPGTRIQVSAQSWLLCAGCGELKCTPGSELICPPCKLSFDNRLELGYSLRFFQFVLAIISWALSCSGQLPPRTSVPNKDSLRFIFQSLISMITIAATLNSCLLRGEKEKWKGYRTSRARNGKFVFRVELLALVCWLSILGAVVNEGLQLGFHGRFDKIAKAMLSLLVLQCCFFLVSTVWGYKTSLLRRRVRKRWAQYDEYAMA